MNTTPKKFCFVLMPFVEEFDDIYKLGIKQSCLDAGAYCERVDEQIYNETITDRIFNQISKADIVIADMTGRNPNVFYEVGYAHALGKTTILLTQNTDDIPFDLKNHPHIIYNKKIIQLKEELTKRIKWFIENIETQNLNVNIDIDIFLDERSLSNKNIEYLTSQNKNPSPILTLYNKSFETYDHGDYSIGITTDQNYERLFIPKNSKTIKLPDGKFMHVLPMIEDILYPSSYTRIDLGFIAKVEKRNMYGEVELSYNETQEITITLFTAKGKRDFFLTIKYK